MVVTNFTLVEDYYYDHHAHFRMVRPTAVISGSAAARHAAGRKRKPKCPGRRVGWSRRDWLAAGDLNDDLEEEETPATRALRLKRPAGPKPPARQGGYSPSGSNKART